MANVLWYIGIIPKIYSTAFYIINFALLENNILESNEKHLKRKQKFIYIIF